MLHDWDKGWCFSLLEEKVILPGHRRLYSQKAFNAAFAPVMKKLADDMKNEGDGEKKAALPPAYTYVQNGQGFDVVDGTMYVAGHPEVFEFNGGKYVNRFLPRSIPETAKEYTDEGWAAVETVRHHLNVLFGDADAVAYVESWIAMNVQQPGKLIGIAPLIKGIEGDGKTIIFHGLMEELMGEANVGLVSNEEVTDKNTGWANGAAVVAIEELKAKAGENRHHVTNKLKPYITNPKVEIVDKYVKRHTAINSTNYVAMTNFENALPLGNTDRRWLVLFTQWKSISELIEAEGSYKAYFTRLAAAIHDHAAELRKFFIEYKLHPKMHWDMRAPDTKWKAVMQSHESADSGMDLIKSYIEEGELGVCAEVISTVYLGAHLLRDTQDSRPRTRQIAAMLVDLGYIRLPWPFKWEGAKHTLYVKDAKSIDPGKDGGGREIVNVRLRKLLDDTKTDENKASYVPTPAQKKNHAF
ncbi:primase-helicase family protein [Paraburkholderia phymatum]|uniref:Primase-helicase family protein n=1 Tax=Paraburkholderia phymatum TaxID=148447 RepID=A0ACC6U0W0_9BURK